MEWNVKSGWEKKQNKHNLKFCTLQNCHLCNVNFLSVSLYLPPLGGMGWLEWAEGEYFSSPRSVRFWGYSSRLGSSKIIFWVQALLRAEGSDVLWKCFLVPSPCWKHEGIFFLWYLLWETGQVPGDKYYNVVGSTLQLDSFGIFKLSELCILDFQQFIIGSCGRFLPRVSALVSHDCLYLAFCLSDLGYDSSLCVLPSLSNLGWLFSLFRFSLVRMDRQLLSFLHVEPETGSCWNNF